MGRLWYEVRIRMGRLQSGAADGVNLLVCRSRLELGHNFAAEGSVCTSRCKSLHPSQGAVSTQPTAPQNLCPSTPLSAPQTPTPQNGKYLKKKNTFTDFIACAEHLIKVGVPLLG